MRTSNQDVAERYPITGQERRRLPGSAEQDPSRIDDIRKIARAMDAAITIGPFSIGLDGIIGLLPGFGDFLTSLVSFYIVYRASQEGAPRSVIARMLANVAIDTLVGTVPFLGDLFDFMWKANLKNVRLYDEWLAGRHRPGRDWLYVIVAILSVLAALLIPIVVFILLIRTLIR